MKRIAILFFVILVLVVLSSKCTLEQRRYFVFSTPFDEKRWKINDAETRWRVRPGMARDLIKRNTLIGKDCSEVNELLNIYSENVCDDKVAKFELKQFYSWNIDPVAIEFLKVHFDENHKVTKADIEFYKMVDW